jgi:hypothetical protein
MIPQWPQSGCNFSSAFSSGKSEVLSEALLSQRIQEPPPHPVLADASM